MQASPEQLLEPDDAVTLITASRRYQVATRDLQEGMFVAELDRPWLDTPFLLQGFLADSQVEIDTLRKYCTYVYIDLELSSAAVAGAIRRAEVRTDPTLPPDRRSLRAAGEAPLATGPAPAERAAVPERTPAAERAAADRPAPASERASPARETPESDAAGSGSRPVRRKTATRVYKTRSDVHISTDTRQRFRDFVRATAGMRSDAPDRDDTVVGRALGWLRGRFGASGQPAAAPRQRARSTAEQVSRAAIRAWVPPEITLTQYAETRSVEQELPRARSSFGRSEDVLKAVSSDIRVGKIPQVAEVASAVDEMVDSMIDNPDALMWVGRLREEDVNTYNHGVKVALYLISLGRQLGFPKPELSHLGLIGMLADVGKIKLPRALLDKPGMLAPSEYGLIKEHVRLGLEAIRCSGTIPPEVEQGISQHHERLDGSGYPNGLKGSEISIYGRMAAIADSFAALITPRAYANALAPQDALMNLYEWAGTSFHEPLVEQFVQAVGVFPVGSLVELSSGEIAVVVAHNRVRRLEPRVLVITWPDKTPLGTPIERDLLTQAKTETGARLRIVRGLPAGAYGLRMRDFYMGEIARANDLPG